MSDRRREDPWTLVHRGRGHKRPRAPANVSLPVSRPPTSPHRIRRSYASVTWAYRPDRVPHGPSPRSGRDPPRAPRGPSPRGSGHHRPGGSFRTFRPDQSPRREGRRRRGPGDRGARRAPHRLFEDLGYTLGADERCRLDPRRRGFELGVSHHSRTGDAYARDGSGVPPPTRARPPAPDAPRSTDPDFSLKNRLVFAAIKAAHHLANVTGPEPPVTIARITGSLVAAIRPAVPNTATLSLIEGNARNWAHTTSIILRDHYRDTVVDKVLGLSRLPEPAWNQNFDIAAAWARRHFGPRLRQATLDEVRATLRRELNDAVSAGGSLPLSYLQPPPSPPAVPPSGAAGPAEDIVGPRREDDGILSPARPRSVSLFSSLSFPSSPLPPPFSPLPPPSSLSTPPPPAPPPPLSSLLSLLPPVPVFPPDFFSPIAGSQPSPDPPRKQRTPRPSRGSALRPPATPPPSAPALPGRTPPNGHASTAADLDAVPLATPRGSVRSRLVFDPPTDGVTPDTPTRRPTRHVSTSKKCKEWALQARGECLIVGDSNLARFPPFQRAGLQVDSFPGATFRHAAAILAKTTISPEVGKVILSFGINDRAHKADQTIVRHLRNAIKMAELAFPRARVLVPEVNFSRSLPHREQDNLRRLNSYIVAHCHSIPALSRNSFNTERDGVHWTHPTASLFLDHWIQALN